MSQWFAKLGVRQKILAVIIVTMVLAVCLSGLAFITYDMRHQQQEMLANISAVAQVTAQRSSAAVAFRDKKRALENLQSFVLVEGVQAACLYSLETNQAIAQWQSSAKIADVQCYKEALAEPVFVTDNEFLLVLPVVSQATTLGYLSVVGSFKPLLKRVKRVALSLLIISVLASLFAFFLTRPLQQKIYLPIVHLGEVARLIGKQSDYTVRAVKTSPDELGDTVDAFNSMLSRLEEDKVALEKLAYFDTLTGLPNRRLFMEKLARAIAHARINKLFFGLVFIDLDNFKWVNDNLGHDRGDWLLKIVADRTRNAVRDMDVVCRLGGDEFTVILLELNDRAQGEALCENILAALQPKIQLGDHSHQAGASLGLAISDGFHETIDGVIKKADLAVYQAKAAGKNTYRVYRAGS
ncbi:diguanylate cyclase [Simiduia curdlanivorans]|uniref:Diguanylate cyclase domain-containing protein n=1 Tax=Simiduia curdlanivorans TaxID=1492769 RepID=A0ABV8V082_9GAMM|nr:sensor domain-containing diguanylate cyclase [Simiduia curdlanivorans]MDN3637855.1 diguanylate cyclase [Simiduia curdlanivorans]